MNSLYSIFKEQPRIKATIELPDGRVVEIVGFLTGLDGDYDLSDTIFSSPMAPWVRPPAATFTIRGRATVSRRDDVDARMQSQGGDDEWRCPYCGNDNPGSAYFCSGCSGVRPIIFG